MSLDEGLASGRGAWTGRPWLGPVLFGLLGLLLVAVLQGWPPRGERAGGEATSSADGPRSPYGSAHSPANLGSLAPSLPKTTSPLVVGEGAAAREERLLISRLRRQGVIPEGAGSLTHQERVLYPELLTHIADSSNWMPELMKASSSILPRGDGEPTLLSLDRVAADSVLWEFGLREGDVIALIDGEIPQFSPTRVLDYIRKADEVMATLDKGGPASLTILRHGQPLHLVYRRW
ncbi:MAG: hypothetical protein WAT36_00705 [Chromatiaceae bacterium]